MNTLENSLHQFFGIEKKEDSLIVAGLFKKETVLKNEFLLKANTSCYKFSFVESGLIRQFIQLSEKEVTQWIGTPGSFITDFSSFLFRTKSTWNFQAISDCEVYSISYEDYIVLNQFVPKWNEFEKVFISKCAIYMESRILSLISLSSEERYKLLFDQHRDLFNQVPLQYLASMLGMTAETFSRIRNKKSS